MSRNSVIVISITLEYNIIIYLEIYDGKKAGIKEPQYEETIMTNFIK